MPTWEYKVLTSGALGFASPQLLEQHLNQLGKEEWEIIQFQTRPDNPLAFHGLARRPIMRDWVVEAAPAEAPALRSGAIPAPPEERSLEGPSTAALRAEAEERRESLLAHEESLRPLRGEAGDDQDERAGAAEFDAFDEEEDLPTFFEAIRPHMRRNQKGPGMAVSVEFLAKKFEQTEVDLVGALRECGFTIPAGPKAPPAFLEYDGDLYWLNLNSRHQLWINTREKARPAFKVAPGRPVTTESIPEAGDRAPETESERTGRERSFSGQAATEVPEPLPSGSELLDRLRPLMRRNRRDSGLSGSAGYLARALKTEAKALETAFGAVGLTLPPAPGGEPVSVAIGEFVYWLERDKSGQLWINARQQGSAVPAQAAEAVMATPGELRLEPAATGPDAAASPLSAEPAANSPLAAVRLLLKETRRGGVAAEAGRLAAQLGKTAEEMLTTLVGVGLKVPEKPREKPVFVEHAGEIFWLNRNARGELWLNAKAAQFAGGADGAGVARKMGHRAAGRRAAAV